MVLKIVSCSFCSNLNSIFPFFCCFWLLLQFPKVLNQTLVHDFQTLALLKFWIFSHAIESMDNAIFRRFNFCLFFFFLFFSITLLSMLKHRAHKFPFAIYSSVEFYIEFSRMTEIVFSTITLYSYTMERVLFTLKIQFECSFCAM